MLNIGDVKTLNLILCSPGGDGVVVEKFVSLCRSQCKKFRVLIPYEAKSAATLIALGADEIIMGPQSEIGPIDAQVEVIANGVRRLISAQSFIDVRNELLEKHKEQLSKNEDTTATMQMIATLDLPFITECERLMDFGRDVAKKLLESV
jgi:ClpP class serine protease